MFDEIEWLSPFTGSWDSVYSTVVTAVLLYPFLILAIRVAGKRSVAQMNNFDWIVTVAIGSIIASAIGFEDVTIVDAVVSMTVLLCLQWMITRLVARHERMEHWVKARPALLLHEGRMLRDVMLQERISEGEIYSALRDNGISDPADCYAVILESNAVMTVLRSSDVPVGRGALSDVRPDPSPRSLAPPLP